MREKKYTKKVIIRLTEQQYFILSHIPGDMSAICRSLISKGLKEYGSYPLI